MIDGSKTNEETEELRKIEQAYIIAQIRPLQVFHFSPTSYRSVKQSYCNHETKLLDDFVDSVNNILLNLQEQHNATPLGDHLRSGQYCPPLTTSELFISTNETAGEENKDTLSVTFREQRRATAVHKELLRSSDSFTRNNSSFPFTPIPVQNPPKPEQMNMDDDLWMKVCANFNDEAESSLFYLRLNTREKIIAYLKSHVTGINAFHGEQASVFMTLVVKLYRLHCSRSSIKKLLSPKSHPVVCAAAMVLMRFTQSPEEVLWLFQNAGLLDLPSAESMFNENQPVSEVAVMPSSIGQHEEMSERKELDALIPVTNTSVIHLGELARRLLLEDEVLEAWFPIYPPHVLATLRDSVNGHCEAVSSICKHSSSSKTKSRATTFTTLFGPFEDLPTLVRHLNQTASTFAPSEDGSYEVTNEEALQKQQALGGHSRKRSGTSNTFRDHKNMKAKEDGHSKGLKTDSSTSKYQNAANIPQHPTSLKRRRPVNTAPYLS